MLKAEREESRGRILSLQFTITFYADSTQEGKAGRTDAWWKRRLRERTNGRARLANLVMALSLDRSVGRSAEAKFCKKILKGGMKLRTNVAMHKVRTLPCPCIRLRRFVRFEGTWTYIALMMKNGVISGQFALQHELRQFAARALRLIERAIMANFREGVWVATDALLAPSLQIWCLLCARFVTAEGEGKENMLACSLAHVEMKGH